MKWMTTSALAVLLAVTSSGAVPAEQAAASAPGGPVRINGWALNMSNIATGANQTIQIDINGWSTQGQRAHLIQTFMEKKQDGLVRELEKQPDSGVSPSPLHGPDPNNVMRLGTDIRYAMNHPGEDGGRRIVIITPRVIGFPEAREQPRTIDYPFTLFEMRFDKNGQGRRPHGLRDPDHVRQEEEYGRAGELLQRAREAQPLKLEPKKKYTGPALSRGPACHAVGISRANLWYSWIDW